MKQPELEQLEKSLTSNDPLDVVNAFIRKPLGVPNLDEYWVHRLCCLAEMIIKNRK